MIEGILGSIYKALGFLMAPLLAFIGYVGWSVRQAHIRLDTKASHNDVRDIIADKVAVLQAQHQGFAHRLDSMEAKIDRLIDLHLKKS